MLGSLVAFDLDGTLVDSRPEITVAIELAWRAVIGDEVTFPRDRFRIGPPLADTIAVLAPDLDEPKRSAIAARFRSHYDASDFSATPPYPGIEELVHTLGARQARLGVATNKRRDPTLAILARWFPARFPHVACVDGVFPDDGTRPNENVGLPHLIKAEMMRWLDRQGEKPRATILVGDTTGDIAAARAAGARVVAVTWGYEEETALAAARPDELVREVAELLPALERLARTAR